ncbi:MAG: cytochrome C [Betaproteobacteria bacterium]|nr:cytochrome C [Betaproteobacteria bacterium]
MSRRIFALAAIAGLASVLAAPAAQAIPAFARQTGQNCNACHVSFPELTPYGRYFKLSGYTLGKPLLEYPENLPLAVMAQFGVTDTRNNTYSDGSKVDPHNGEARLQMASVFLGGKVNDHLGGFVQWTASYNGSGYDFGADNTDIRLVNTRVAPGGQEPDLIYGLTVNNNPTSQDVWNSTPAWQFPYSTSATAITGFANSSMIDGGTDPAGNDLHTGAVGFGGYVFWKQTIYAELSLYRTDNGLFSVFDLGNDPDSTMRPYIKGYAPYWRLAYNKQWGPSSIEVGTFGMLTDRYADGSDGGPTDRYKDIGLDAQYQYITDVNTWTAQTSYIHENQDWNLSGPANLGLTSNPNGNLNTFRIKGSYWYRHKYGATLGYFASNGSEDATLYGGAGSLNNKPDTSGYILEADYMPWDYVRVMLQYTAYNKYLGGSTYTDPGGGLRNASDNNSVFLNLWVAY